MGRGMKSSDFPPWAFAETIHCGGGRWVGGEVLAPNSTFAGLGRGRATVFWGAWLEESGDYLKFSILLCSFLVLGLSEQAFGGPFIICTH